jgi:hypothetical protein
MPIVQQGQVNTTALTVPQLLIQIVPPQVTNLNGVPSNVAGVVGTASWGPVGAPVPVSTYQDYVRTFGQLQARKYDMGTMVAMAVQQGANNFRCVRVSDGTDVAATVVVPTNAITLTSRYTGTLGNSIAVTLAPGSAANSWRATVSLPAAGMVPEVFDNVTGTGAAFWANLAAAINNGQNGVRGASEIIVATAGAGTTAPAAATYTLTGGLDGATTITASTLLGVDTVPRKGMYALRGSGVSCAVLADCDDTSTWAAQVAFAMAEGMLLGVVGASGESVTSAQTAKTTAGIDSYALKVLLGDWLYWNDTVNGQNKRLVSPQGAWLGLRANLSPEQSSLNKQVYGIIGTQRSAGNRPYSDAELTILASAGIDVICNPVPGGSYFGVRFGRNSSSDVTRRGENYTMMINYLASTLNAGMGGIIGKPNTSETRRQTKVTLDNFLGGLQQQGMIEDYLNICDDTNNPKSRVQLGYMQADSQVRFLSITEYLIVNLEGGQTVQITRQAAA